MRPLSLFAAACVMLGVLVSPAMATEASFSEVRALAQRAVDGDAAALETLRMVTSIEGTPVDMDSILSGDSAAARAAAIASLPDAAPVAERDLSAILDQLYGEDRDPSSGSVTTTAPPLSGGGSSGSRGFDLGSLFGIPWLIILAAVLLALLVFTLLRRGTSPAAPTRREGRAATDPRPVGADLLEMEADAAERAGAYAEAIRLRFKAATVRLAESRVLRSASLVTSGAVRRAVPSERTNELVGTYDRVAYGGRAAAEDDARAAREGWPEVIEEGRSGRG